MPTLDPCHIWVPMHPSTTGFVFLCPGRHEKNKNRPCAGATGRNLDDGLVHLARLRRAIFPSANRYDYLLTNSWPTIEYRAATERSGCDWHELVAKGNLERLHDEIKDLKTVIACGEEARVAVQLCAEFLGLKATFAYASHTARAALGCPTKDAYPLVIRAWAEGIASQLPRDCDDR